LYYLRLNSDVDAYCEKVFSIIPQYESKAKVLAAIVTPEKRLPKCVICGEYISNKIVKSKWKKGKKAYFCSQKCAMTEKGKQIQVDLYKVANPVNPMKRPEVREKQKQTIIEKYGVDNVSKLPEIRKKANQTTFERYGVYNMWLHADTQKKITSAAGARHYESLAKNIGEIGMEVLFSLDEYINKALKGEYVPFKCKNCGEIIHKKIFNHSSIYCKKCHSPGTSSKEEMELYNWLSQYIKCETGVYDILENNFEIDIYSRDKKIGIEFDGLLWHSEFTGKDENYHLKKTEECQSKNIRLIHIFEDEWKYKSKIIKSRLKSVFGLIKQKIYARKCNIKLLEKKVSEKFLEKYHLQGKDNSSIQLGLFYRNRLVAVMTFGKPRFNKNYSWELIRYASVANFNIVGGAGKLLKYFRKNFVGSIITYADRRFSEGNLYNQLGFKHIGNSKPNYFYTKGLQRLSRYKCQKHKLKDLLKEMYDENLSEHQNMNNNKFYKIWDCGNMIFTLDN
jgi:hypothetical protein